MKTKERANIDMKKSIYRLHIMVEKLAQRMEKDGYTIKRK